MNVGVEEEYEALLQFLYLSPVALVQTRLDGEITMCNPLCAQLLLPLAPGGQLSNLFDALANVAPDLRQRVQGFGDPSGKVCDNVQLLVQSSQPGRKEAQVLCLNLLKLDAERLMAVLSDVTQAVRRERELRQSQAWIHTIATGLTEYALMALDHQGRLLGWNPSIGRVTGFADDGTRGRCFSMFYPPDVLPPERALDRLHAADTAGWSIDEGWRVRADGTQFWGSCLIAPLHGDEALRVEERSYSLIIRDISDRREASEALRHSVSCDHLTGLANRRAFFEAAELEVQHWHRSPRALAAVMIDADHFKAINDQHGHAAGDAVLRHLALCLQANFRAIDVVARIGGEEFIALLPGTTAESAEAVALRLCQAIASQVVLHEGTAIRYTVSAGVAVMEEGVGGVNGLVHRADAAMYAAKAAGRNGVRRWADPAQGASLATKAA